MRLPFQTNYRDEYPVFFLTEGEGLQIISSTTKKAFLRFYENPGAVGVKADTARESHTICSFDRYKIERYQLAPPKN